MTVTERFANFLGQLLQQTRSDEAAAVEEVAEQMMLRATIRHGFNLLEVNGGPVADVILREERSAMLLQDSAMEALAITLSELRTPVDRLAFTVIDSGDVRAGTAYRLRMPNKASNSVTQDGWLVPTYFESDD